MSANTLPSLEKFATCYRVSAAKVAAEFEPVLFTNGDNHPTFIEKFCEYFL
jgi:hypothetical protein